MVARGTGWRLSASFVLVALGCANHPKLPPGVEWSAAMAGAVKVVPNVAYGPLPSQTLDFYLLATPTPPPVLLYFHGGGFTARQKEEMNVEILPYLALGFSVANVEYRLAKEALAPAAVEDACCALRWVSRNGGDYYVDRTRIVLAGGSAGGHLALMAGMAGAEFAGDCAPDAETGQPPADEPQVAAILNWDGPTDLTELTIGGHPQDWAVTWLGPDGDRAARADWLSPLRYVHAGGPPVLTVHGEVDSLIPYSQAVRLHEALADAGVPNRLVTIAGGGHGGFGPQATADAFAAIREFLAARGLALPPGGPLPH
jgi:acetyl esterase/lipase